MNTVALEFLNEVMSTWDENCDANDAAIFYLRCVMARDSYLGNAGGKALDDLALHARNKAVNTAEVVAVERGLSIMSELALTKAKAIRARTRGAITAAQRLESRVESLYDQLPECMQW